MAVARDRRRPWWQEAWVMLGILSLAVGLLAGAGVALYAQSRPERFASTATLLIDQEPAVFQSGDEGLLGKLSRLRYKYVGLVSTTAFADLVAEDVGLSPASVHQSLVATADIDTMLVDITAVMPSKAQARIVAQAAADELVKYLHDEQDDVDIPAQDQVFFSVVSAASAPKQIEPSTKKVLLEGVVVFLVITVVGGLGADLLRRRTV